jgi:CrcB protein
VGFITVKEVTDPARVRALLGTGLCGGLTTFSTLCSGVVELAHNHHLETAALYLITTTLAGLLAVSVGYRAAAIGANVERKRSR